jgi:hypothetical protein
MRCAGDTGPERSLHSRDPSNEAAIGCYRGAGFVRATPGVKAGFNVGQPHEYVCMRLETAD